MPTLARTKIFFPLVVFVTLIPEIPRPRAVSSMPEQASRHGRANAAAAFPAAKPGVAVPVDVEASRRQSNTRVSSALVADAGDEHWYFLPQVAVGKYAEGSFRTTFLIFNPSDAIAVASIQLTTLDRRSVADFDALVYIMPVIRH